VALVFKLVVLASACWELVVKDVFTVDIWALLFLPRMEEIFGALAVTYTGIGIGYGWGQHPKDLGQ
jgi:hypothetical protein